MSRWSDLFIALTTPLTDGDTSRHTEKVDASVCHRLSPSVSPVQTENFTSKIAQPAIKPACSRSVLQNFVDHEREPLTDGDTSRHTGKQNGSICHDASSSVDAVRIEKLIPETSQSPIEAAPFNTTEIVSSVEVFLDFETQNRSGCNLKRAGVHRYAADPTTDVIVLPYHHAGADYRWKPEDGLREPLAALATDPGAIFVSHGVFDLIVWNTVMALRYGFPTIPPERWVDTVAVCGHAALPLELEKALPAIGSPVKKDMAGSRFTRDLSKSNKKGEYPEIMPGIRDRVAQYSKADVDGARAIYDKFGPLPEREQQIWLLDRRVNDRGLLVDLDFVRKAKCIVEVETERLVAECQQLTGLNPSQVKKLLQQLTERGCNIDNLKKSSIQKCLDQLGLPEVVRRILKIRLVTAAKSHRKLDAILRCVGADGRCRGLFQYHGAVTGRWTGRLVQVQNLPRPTVDIDPDQLVAAVMSGDPAVLGDAPIDTIVSGLRHAFIGNQLGCGDFATIELRLLLWHAGQMDKLELIRNGADPYRDFAAGLFRIGDREAYLATPKDAMTFEQKHHRQVGKPFVLGAGYSMGVDRFHGQEPDVPFELIKPGIDHYRRLWAPKVPRLWNEFDWAARTAMRSPGKVVETSCGVRFEMQADRLAVRLISGKEIFFPGAHIDGPDWWFYVNEDGRWQRRKGYGGLVTARVISATAREILADAMLRAEAQGLPIVMHCHDEIVIEHPAITKQQVEEVMLDLPAWVTERGIPIAVEAWVGPRYRK